MSFDYTTTEVLDFFYNVDCRLMSYFQLSFHIDPVK